MTSAGSNPCGEVRAPLFERLRLHALNKASSYHVPGHKNGQGYKGTEAEQWFDDILRLDVTEIEGMDDLHRPEGEIAEAEKLAAAWFGAEETAFLVGGSTVGNLAMVLSVCGADDILIVQRNSHKSVLHALQLAGARAVFVEPRICSSSGLAGAVSAEDLRHALELNPQAKGVLLTNPNYYGMGADLAKLADVVHEYGMPLLVDEAHGAHYGLHPDFPASAMQAGADAAVQSAHKMLNAMTMGAYLHLRGDRVPREFVRQLLRMLQTSSPSYPILASLDLARQMVQCQGEQAFAAGLAAVGRVREWLQRPKNRFREAGNGPEGGACETKDPFKLAVYDARGEWDGFALMSRLVEFGCYAEMADPSHVLFAFSGANTDRDAERLIAALEAIAESEGEGKAASGQRAGRGGLPSVSSGRARVSEPTRLLSWRVAASGNQTVLVPLEDSVGRIAAEAVIPYPPGVPLALPGETIREEMRDELRRLWQSGCRFQGGFDASTGLIRVVDGSRL